MLFLLYLTLIQSLISALLIFFNKKFKQEDFYLSLFFGIAFFHILFKIALIYAYQDANLFEKFHGSFSFLYGPILYFYTQSVLGKKIVNRQIFYHCLPFFIGFVLTILVVFISENHPFFFFIVSTSSPVVMFFIVTSFFIYVLYSLRLVANVQEERTKIFNLKLTIIKVICIIFILLGLLISWGLFLTVFNYPSSINLRFVFYIFMLFIFVYVIHIRFSIFFEMQKESLSIKAGEKYKNYELDTTEMAQIISAINVYFTVKKGYLDSEFNLDKLSSDLRISKVKITQTLNVQLKTNFYQYINSLRVEEAKKLIDTMQTTNFVAIGYESGFKNKSTFYKYFKQITGATPSDYKKMLVE